MKNGVSTLEQSGPARDFALDGWGTLSYSARTEELMEDIHAGTKRDDHSKKQGLFYSTT